MLLITKDGLVDAGSRVKMKIFPTIERGRLEKVNGIVVHQTGGPSAESAYGSYRRPGAHGAHFMIDLDGQIYQNASLYAVTHHVGHVQARCLVEMKCSPAELKIQNALRGRSKLITRREESKAWPDRYPGNTDSIGIELVGNFKLDPGTKKEIYDPVNDVQNASLKWLVNELLEVLEVSPESVYRHPEIGRKNPTEASTAKRK